MKVGAPFNPYKVFQGAFAPYWILEHRGISAGAKLCYIRLLGFAGKDARCYPSLDTLGAGLGVSDRQARDYVKELERAGLITVDQRGLRKTNVYLFVWTAELAQLLGAVPDRSTDHGDLEPGSKADADSDRNTASGPERNTCSGLDRKDASVLERNTGSAPIGINSEGINSLESSSSSKASGASVADADELLNTERNRTAQAIRGWVAASGIKRLGSGRRIGLPEKETIDEWARILLNQQIEEASSAEAVLERALDAANRSGPWRSWRFLTLQIQIAAEQCRLSLFADGRPADPPPPENPREETPSEWKLIKERIREHISEIAFLNWFEATRQIERCGDALAVAVPDEPTAAYITAEYGSMVHTAAATAGVTEVRYVVEAGEGSVNQQDLPGTAIGCLTERDRSAAVVSAIVAG
jgi:hypothetical protein